MRRSALWEFVVGVILLVSVGAFVISVIHHDTHSNLVRQERLIANAKPKVPQTKVSTITDYSDGGTEYRVVVVDETWVCVETITAVMTGKGQGLWCQNYEDSSFMLHQHGTYAPTIKQIRERAHG